MLSEPDFEKLLGDLNLSPLKKIGKISGNAKKIIEYLDKYFDQVKFFFNFPA